MRKVIVTGATSYIARSLIDKLIQEKYLVYAIIRPKSSNRSKIPVHSNIKVIELDMVEIERLSELEIGNVDAIYHFAWEGVRGKARNDSAVQFQNYKMLVKCIETSINLQIPYFIGIGSQAEYGVTHQVTTENIPLHPVSEYGKYKVASYNYGMKEADKIRFIWARVFSAYGKDENPNTLLMQCIDKMRKNESIDLSPCEHMWDYTYVDDIAKALFLLMSKKADSGAYNISYGEAKKLKDFVLQIKNIMKSESSLNFGSIPYQNDVILEMNPDVTKLKEETGWRPEIDFETGIERIIKG